MKITIQLFGRFKEQLGSDLLIREVPEGTTVGDLYQILNIEEKIYRMALINGFRTRESQLLKDNDTVHIFQPVGGG